MLEVFFANAFTVLSFNPRFKMVSIIPGIETLAPDLTETKSGLFKSPNFFEDVIVNDGDEVLKKNRLELLQLLCKTFNNYINFSNIEST